MRDIESIIPINVSLFDTSSQNRGLAQINPEHRFQTQSTTTRDFLVTGGTKSFQEPKRDKGYQNRPETLPNKSVDKDP